MSQAQLVQIGVLVLVVARFLARELRTRTLRLSTLWIRPAILMVLTAAIALAAIT